MAVRKYRFCPLGHRVVYAGLAIPPCSVCGQRVDRSTKEYILTDEDEAKETAAASRVDAAPKEPVAPVREEVPARPETPVRQETPVKPETPAEPEVTVRRRRAVNADGAPEETGGVRTPVGRRPVGSGWDTPADNGAGAPDARVQPEQSRGGNGIRLDFLGSEIRLPPEGGWLGRGEIGGELLVGYPLVSRRHAYVKPERGGRLMVTDQGSLNGTWYTRNGEKNRLETGRTEILEAGDVLWLYNIPLKVVADDV